MSDLTTILAEHQARRSARDTARQEFDAAALPLLRRFVAASFREHAGLRALALAAYQDYDSSRLVGHVYVDNNRLADDAWQRAGFPGECPTNELDSEVIELISDRLDGFLPSLMRVHGLGWCVAFWRDPTAKDGVATEQRDHPGFD